MGVQDGAIVIQEVQGTAGGQGSERRQQREANQAHCQRTLAILQK
jgi:hypothetical protein